MIFDADNYTKRSRPLWLVTVLSDAVTILVSCLLAIQIRNLFGGVSYPVESIAVAIFLYAMVSVVVFFVVGLYSSRRFKPFWFEAQRVFFSNVIMLVLAMAALYFFKLDNVSRLMLVVVFFLSTTMVILERLLWRKVILCFRKKGMGLHRLLVVGSDVQAEKFYLETVCSGKAVKHGFTYIGYLSHEENPKIGKYLGDTSRLKTVFEEQGIDEVIITASMDDHNTLGNVIAICGRFGAKVSIVPEFGKYLPMKTNIDVVGDMRMVTLRSSPNEDPGWNVLKRGMDIVGSVVGLVLASPIMLYAVIVIKTASPDGPVVFRQTRCGRNGKPFTMYKFRTMVPNAESLRNDLQGVNEAEGPVFKMKEDPRIIKHGAFLRKMSIDEIPQFVNVLAGSMSLVGPRPPIMSEVQQYKDWQLGRLSVKPGLTCYWQISGRSDIGFDDWMRMDLRYVADQSFMTDMLILVKTIGVVFSGKGAR